MSVPFYQLRNIRIINAEDLSDADCAICLGGLREDFATSNDPAELLSASEQQLYDQMIRLTQEQHISFEMWSQYWQERTERCIQLGADVSEQQAGYMAQQEFRETVTQARSEQLRSLHHGLQEFRQSQNYDSREMSRTLSTISTKTQPPTSYTNIPAVIIPDIEHQQRAAEGVARWNLFAARSTAEEGSVSFEVAWLESINRFKNAVEAARSKLERTKHSVPRWEEWEEDPPNPL